MATLHILHGLPGTGKSTLAQKLSKRGRTIVLNNDDWMIELYGTDQTGNCFSKNRAKIEKIQWELAASLLKEDIDVVWDYGVWTKEERLHLKLRATEFGVSIILYNMVCPWELALERVLNRKVEKFLEINEEAMKKFSSIFESVEKSEGFNVIDIDTNQSLEVTGLADARPAPQL